MTSSTYQACVEQRLAGSMNMAGIGLGLTGEGAEFMEEAVAMVIALGKMADAIKKHDFHLVPMDCTKVDAEAGDVLWYLTAYCIRRGITLEDLMKTNTAKLMKRYPDQFVTGGGIRE